MKKTLLLLFALLTGVSGAWAFDVTIIKSTVSETTYGSLSSGTFTTNGTSGLNGVTVSGISNLQNTSFAYGSSLGFASTASGTITVTVPDGYKIIGYSLFARSNTYSVPYTLTPAAGGSAVTTSTGGVMLTTHGIDSKTTSITYSASSANSFYIPQLVLSVKTDAAEAVDVVYKEVWDGDVKVTHNTVSHVVGEAPNLWEYYRNRAYCTYKYYSTQDCSGEELTSLTSSSTTVFVKPVFNPPFTLSSAFDGATWYYVYFNRDAGKRYWQMNPNSTPYPDQTSKPSVSEAIWAFTGNPYDGIKVMNARAGDGYYLKKKGTNSGDAITMQANGQSWAIGTGNGGFYLKEDGTNYYIHDYSSKLAVWNSGSAATDKGSAIVVEDATPIKVTYKLTYNGNVISSYTKDLYELVGATAAAPFNWELPPYCSLGSCTPATITAETTEVTIPLNWNGPFDFSTDYEHAVWYYMNVGGKWAKYVASGDYPLYDEVQTGDAGLWAFVGNPIDGVECYNKSAGNAVKLNMDSGLPMSASGYTKCIITKIDANSLYLTNGGYGPRSNLYKMVLGDNKEETHVSPITFRSYYCQQFIDDVYTWADANHRDEPFGPSEASLTDLKNTIISMYSKMTSSQYSGFTIPDDILPNIILKYPTTGSYYRIKNNGTGDYIAYGQPAASGHDKTVGLIAISSANAATDASSIIKLTGSSGTYKLSTEGLNVQSQTTGNQAFPATSSAGVDFVFTSANKNGIVSITNAASRVDDNNDGSLHNATGWTVNGIVNWSASAANSKWVVEDATTVTIPLSYVSSAGASFSTLYLPFGVTITGAKAYYLTVEGNIAHAVEISEVPANTGVLLRAEGNVSSVTATIKADASAEIEGNKLLGTNVGITSARATGEYILGQNEGQIGFYQRGSGYNIGANKAYLKLDADLPAEVKGLRLDWDNATGIETVQGSGLKVNEVIYNLAGQRLSKVQSGVNIVNGKKLLVK